MTLTAITAPDTSESDANIVDIITVDLSLGKNRTANIRHLINLSPLFLTLAGLVPSTNDFVVRNR